MVLGGVSLFGGSGSAIGAIFGALLFRTIGDLLFVFDLDPLWQPLFQGVVLLAVGLHRRGAAVSGAQPPGPVSDDGHEPPTNPRRSAALSCAASTGRSRSPSAASSLLLLARQLYSRSFLSPEYLLQQLKVASFLGVIATGMMIVILLGQIDLSVPWVVAVGGMMSTAATGLGAGRRRRSPFRSGSLCGVALGLVNGFGVAYLRIPSMIVTLAVNAVAQGLMVVHTGGFSPQDSASPAMRFLATGDARLRPAQRADRLGCWSAPAPSSCLTRTTFGRAVYGIGNRERAAYLSGVDTQRVVLLAFAISGGLSAFGGVLLAGYASKAAQAMGDAYLLPAIAAVVLGGASILGGRGTYLGTVAGVILITLLQSILSVMQMPEAGRQIIYGAVIIAMLLLYGRGRRVQG